ncbi:MAG TPA: HAMP domain-containing sensor histidine kinase [Solirubrobacterales bacterium]
MGFAHIGVPAELQAAGWPIGVALAALFVGQRAREARLRASLNLALHELRRPLQELVLSSPAWRDPGSGAVHVTLAALGDLDRAVNGGPRRFAPRPVACRALVQSAVERWRGVAAASHRSLIMRWRAGAALVMVEPERVGQALDNLIHNAILHGGLRVRVEASASAGGVRISVADSGPRSARRRNVDPRHGHGLRVVSAIAAEHGGRFLLRTGPTGTTAILELPFAPRTAVGSAARRSSPGRAPALMPEDSRGRGGVAGRSG